MKVPRWLAAAAPTLFCASCAAVACDGAPQEPLGRVAIAIAEDICADYCLAAIRASVYFDGAPDLPLGPALQATCGTRLTMAALPAGQRVVVEVQGFDITGNLLLTGRSDAVTIVADLATEAHVQLTSAAAPMLVTITPDPIVAGAAMSLEGAFGPRLGKATVEVAGTPLPVAEWRADHITTDPPTSSGPLVVRQCGIASSARELRVIPATLGAAPVARPPCVDAVLTAAMATPEGAFTAWSCGTTGTASAMLLDETVCPLDPGLSWTLPAPPRAIATRGDHVFVGGDDGLWRLDPDGTTTPLNTTPTTALAASPRRVVALTNAIAPSVDTIDGDPIVGLDLTGLTPLALIGTPTGLFIAASVGGEGRLVHVPDAGGVATYALLTPAADGGATRCDAPTALASDGRIVVMTCAQGGLGVWDITTRTLTTIAGRVFDAVALDDAGDVAFTSDPDGLSTIDLVAPDDLAAGPILYRHAHLGTGLLVSLGAHRLLTSTPAVVTPYSEAGPCAP